MASITITVPDDKVTTLLRVAPFMFPNLRDPSINNVQLLRMAIKEYVQTIYIEGLKEEARVAATESKPDIAVTSG
jgi:hypothetical protein